MVTKKNKKNKNQEIYHTYVNPNIINTSKHVKVISDDGFQTIEAIHINNGLLDKYWLLAYRCADGSIKRGFIDVKNPTKADIVTSTNGVEIPTKVKTKKDVFDLITKLENFNLIKFNNFKYVKL